MTAWKKLLEGKMAEGREIFKSGFSGKEWKRETGVIKEFIVGWSYPRNGNVHRPSPEISYVVYDNFGKQILSTSRLKDAKEECDKIGED